VTSLERVLYTADVVYNGVGLPLEDAGVVVAGDGDAQTIVAFGKLEALRAQFAGLSERRLGRAILPRAVNAHTHLDLTGFAFTRAAYPDWMRGLVAQMVQNRETRGVAAARRGLDMIRRSGVAAFGDIVAKAEVVDVLLEESDVSGVAYWEVFEEHPEKADEVFENTVADVKRWRALERPGGMRLGLSPHAPMTVSSALMPRLTEFARLEGLPMQIHVAESPSELELFRTGKGAIADVYASWNMPAITRVIGRNPDAALTPVQYLADIGALEGKPTLIHAVNVTDEDVRVIAQFGCPVVTCPRSNANLQCGAFPWALYAKYGVEVGLGTDSVVSGETLEIRDEAFSALELLGVDLRQVVRWAVKGGFKALGMKPSVVQRGDDFSRLTVWA
jgi:aminodeoxyfutalosine deaminase